MRKTLWPYLMILPLLLLLFGFELLPGLQVIRAAFTTGSGRVTFENLRDVLTAKIWRSAMANSLKLTGWSTMLGLIFSILGAYGLSRSTGQVRQWVSSVISVCTNFSGVPLTFAFIILLGSSGVVAYLFRQAGADLSDHFNLYGPSGLTLVYCYFQIPLGIFLLLPAFGGLRQEWEEAATILGARPWQFWARIGLPVLAPAIGATATILFANALGAQATAYALTNGMMNLMTIRMARLVSGDIDADPNLASAAAVILAVIMTVAVLLNQWLSRRYQTWQKEGG
jgi:putative spermidine/putrescine transport system permease protein